jgi:hypothetical protein
VGFVVSSPGKSLGNGQSKAGWFVDLQPVHRSIGKGLPHPFVIPLKVTFCRWSDQAVTCASSLEGVAMYQRHRNSAEWESSSPITWR